MLLIEGPVTPCRNLRANRSCRDGVAKCERRGNGGNGLRALAGATNGQVAVVQKAAKNALVDVDALDLVEAYFEGPPLDETCLVDDPHIGDVGLGGPAVEPGLPGPVQRDNRRHGRGRQA